ncbi:hypothetical protein ACFWB3_29815 [[Kitasatospora] papulosa]|uniref:hypothetical protein n=1 Tax=[Kitasatospora] papulosa TaxID=1464011 RepID=UPI00367430BF
MSRSVQDLGEADKHGRAVGVTGDQGPGMVGEVLVEVAKGDAPDGPGLGNCLEGLRPVEVGQ